jgi:TRAP-type mannitol/chloroaromatic compound transport system permease small subunit
LGKGPQHNLIDRISVVIGNTTAWMTLFMVIVTFAVVILRKTLNVGFIWLQESVVWMHAAVFMLGAACTLHAEEHVRVDVFYRDMSPRRRAWIDVAGVLLFLLPVCAFLAWKSFDFVAQSWSIRESSREAGGLPYPFVPLLKTVLLLMPLTLALQGLSLLLKSVRSLRES